MHENRSLAPTGALEPIGARIDAYAEVLLYAFWVPQVSASPAMMTSPPYFLGFPFLTGERDEEGTQWLLLVPVCSSDKSGIGSDGGD